MPDPLSVVNPKVSKGEATIFPTATFDPGKAIREFGAARQRQQLIELKKKQGVRSMFDEYTKIKYKGAQFDNQRITNMAETTKQYAVDVFSQAEAEGREPTYAELSEVRSRFDQLNRFMEFSQKRGDSAEYVMKQVMNNPDKWDTDQSMEALNKSIQDNTFDPYTPNKYMYRGGKPVYLLDAVDDVSGIIGTHTGQVDVDGRRVSSTSVSPSDVKLSVDNYFKTSKGAQLMEDMAPKYESEEAFVKEFTKLVQNSVNTKYTDVAAPGGGGLTFDFYGMGLKPNEETQEYYTAPRQIAFKGIDGTKNLNVNSMHSIPMQGFAPKQFTYGGVNTKIESIDFIPMPDVGDARGRQVNTVQPWVTIVQDMPAYSGPGGMGGLGVKNRVVKNVPYDQFMYNQLVSQGVWTEELDQMLKERANNLTGVYLDENVN